MYEIVCRRPGCCAPLPACAWAPRTYCGLPCYWLDLRRLAVGRRRPVYRRRRDVPSPANNVQHRKARDQQLELIGLELERIRAARKVDAA